MIFNLIVIAIVIVGAVVWGSKSKGYGLFSALLALACTVAAGAIAFAAWEPIVYGIIFEQAAGNRILEDVAWGLGLLAPFIVALLILRLAVDSLVKANLRVHESANFAGGAIFGAVNVALTLGIVLIGIGHMRLPPAIAGYQPITDEGGSPVYASSLWIPVDTAAANLYEHLSVTTFQTDTPLARRLPEPHVAAGMARLTYEGASRVSIAPEDFEVLGQYTLQGNAQDLLRDSALPRPQDVTYPWGEKAQGPSTLHGFVIRFSSGAKEAGKVVVTPSQLRLTATNNNETIAVNAVAVVARTEAGSLGLYRFRFDVRESVIASVGGGADAVFAFEFIIPQGFQPLDLFVKNARVILDNTPAPTEYRSVAARDANIQDYSLFTDFGVAVPGQALAQLDREDSESLQPTSGGRYEGIDARAGLPGNIVINKASQGALRVDDDNRIIGGESQYSESQLASPGLDSALRIDEFATTRDTVIVKLQLADEGARSLLGRTLERARAIGQPLLFDANGEAYEAIGFVYQESGTVRIRFTPDRPLRALSEAPQLSRTKPDQSLWLIFRPTKGVNIVSFTLGSKEIVRFQGDGFPTD